jgi:hypothetical protein
MKAVSFIRTLINQHINYWTYVNNILFLSQNKIIKQ